MINTPHGQSVCVIIAAYKAEATIARAVRSALSQLQVTEVIVVDDASCDNTAGAARSADDGSGRLSVLTQSQNAGPSAARNRALRQSNAAWFAILDADDFFLPGRIDALMQYAEQADFIADNMWQVKEGDIEGPRKSLLTPPPTQPFSVSFEEFVRSNVTSSHRHRRELGFIQPLIRGDFLRHHGILHQERMRLGEDYELYARALGMGARMLVIPNHGYVCVVRDQSLSSVHSEEDLRRLRDCDLLLEKELTLSRREKAALKAHYRSVDCRYQWRMLIVAVKQRKFLAGLKTFLRPWPVPKYLGYKLAEQFAIRVLRIKAPA